MYAIDGRPVPDEEILPHLDGYKGSRPVRIGNGAVHQLQLDIYGELMDSVYLYNKYGSPISHDLWRHLRRLTNWVCDHWTETDEGIWEVRGGRRHFVYSKLMCWVAVDRALRLMQKRSFPSDWQRWIQVRDEIYADIMKNGWNEQRKAFVQAYGSDSLDASTLMMPLVFFVSPTDPAHARDPRRDQSLAGAGRARLQQPRLPLRRPAHARRHPGRRRDLQHLHVLAGGGPGHAPPAARTPAACATRV